MGCLGGLGSQKKGGGKRGFRESGIICGAYNRQNGQLFWKVCPSFKGIRVRKDLGALFFRTKDLSSKVERSSEKLSEGSFWVSSGGNTESRVGKKKAKKNDEGRPTLSKDHNKWKGVPKVKVRGGKKARYLRSSKEQAPSMLLR